MRKVIVLFASLLVAAGVYANVNYIDMAKISNRPRFVQTFRFIEDNQQYYDNWTPNWNYSESKVELTRRLEDAYALFSTVHPKSEESFLLLGDIAHYLYNLDDSSYYKLAVGNYNKAIELNRNDFRGYWFLAYHYALSGQPNDAMNYFLKAQSLLPSEQPPAFWDEYATACVFAGMPSHCKFAMDQIRRMTGKPGLTETRLGPAVDKMIKSVNEDSSYKMEDIWNGTTGATATLVCRPLGIKLLVDSSWNLSIYGYANHQSAITLKPQRLKNTEGREIGYTIAILMKVPADTETLAGYMRIFTAKYSDIKEIEFSSGYRKMISYEIIDTNVYQDIGGGHFYMIGVEQQSPEYPGLLLEDPAVMPEGKEGQVNYYTITGSLDRFKGRIFHAILLDTCGDIFQQSSEIFKTFFQHGLIIE